MAAREYTLNFLTTSELAGAQAAEKATEKVGQAATQSGEKLDAFEQEWKATLDRIKGKLDGMRADLHASGKEGGKAAGEGMGQGIELAANTHLVQQAWGIGSMIGKALSEALITTYDGGLEELKTGILAGLGIQSALVEQDLQRQRETLPAAHREIHAAVLRDYRTFWSDYHDAQPETATDWLDAMARKAELAKQQIQALNAVTQQALKSERTDIEQDFLDESQGISKGPDSESVKARKLASAESRKRQREASLREFERQQKAEQLAAEQQAKEEELSALREQEAEQARRAQVFTQAEAAASADIQGRKARGQAMSPEDERATRGQFFDRMGRNAGVTDLSQDKDEIAELLALKKRREAAERELEKTRISVAEKQQILTLEAAADKERTQREQARAEREAEARITEALRNESAQAEKAKAERAAYEAANQPKPAAAPLPAPGQEQAPAADLESQVKAASQTTNNPALKLDLEALRRSLADGASADELKEAAALMQRAAAERNEALASIAAAVRGSVEATSAVLQRTRSEMDALRASVEALKANR